MPENSWWIWNRFQKPEKVFTEHAIAVTVNAKGGERQPEAVTQHAEGTIEQTKIDIGDAEICGRNGKVDGDKSKSHQQKRESPGSEPESQN